MVSYGTKQISYLTEIETKTHKAIFTLSTREDGLGAGLDGVHDLSNRLFKLDKIDLYAKDEIAGVAQADWVPIKTVHF